MKPEKILESIVKIVQNLISHQKEIIKSHAIKQTKKNPYEKLLQKAEQDIRNHISCEQ